MSYADTNCPCSRKKLPDTLICDQCLAVADPIQLRSYQNERENNAWRRAAAIKLLAGARRRNPQMVLR